MSLFCYALVCVHSSFAIILKRKRKLFALLLLSYRCIVSINVLWLFLMVPWIGLQYVIVVFPDQTYLLVFIFLCSTKCLFKFCNVLDGEETAYCITLCSQCLVSVSI